MTDLSLFASTPEEMEVLLARERNNGFESLTPNRRAFCHEYITNGYKHREAAKSVGIAAASGIRVLREPLVGAYISYLQSMQQTSAIITKDYINAQYMALYDMATGLEPQCLVTADGDEFMAKKTELGTAHNILKEMSKSTDYAQETGNKVAAVSVNIDFGNLRGNISVDSHDDASDEGVIIDV